MEEEEEECVKPPMVYDTKTGMVNADDEEPTFDDGVCHDVVERCPNGKIRGISTGAVYVVIRANLDGKYTDCDVLGYSHFPDFGSSYIEKVAARDCYGTFWDYKQGNPCFDPIAEDGSEREPPDCKFMMWDESDMDRDVIDTITVSAITIYAAKEAGEADRRPIRRYKLQKAELTIDDYMALETSGDQKFLQ